MTDMKCKDCPIIIRDDNKLRCPLGGGKFERSGDEIICDTILPIIDEIGQLNINDKIAEEIKKLNSKKDKYIKDELDKMFDLFRKIGSKFNYINMCSVESNTLVKDVNILFDKASGLANNLRHNPIYEPMYKQEEKEIDISIKVRDIFKIPSVVNGYMMEERAFIITDISDLCLSTSGRHVGFCYLGEKRGQTGNDLVTLVRCSNNGKVWDFDLRRLIEKKWIIRIEEPLFKY